MTIDELFEKLRAPLTAPWSRGAVRQLDGAVILQVWADDRTIIDGADTFRVNLRADDGVLPRRERTNHLSAIQSGARCYMVECTTWATTQTGRVMDGFDNRRLLIGGDVIQQNGHTFITVGYE